MLPELVRQRFHGGLIKQMGRIFDDKSVNFSIAFFSLSVSGASSESEDRFGVCARLRSWARRFWVLLERFTRSFRADGLIAGQRGGGGERVVEEIEVGDVFGFAADFGKGIDVE